MGKVGKMKSVCIRITLIPYTLFLVYGNLGCSVVENVQKSLLFLYVTLIAHEESMNRTV